MPNHPLQKAFVLHSRSYRETSLLVDLLTENSGRICVVARGVRKNKSALKGLLQPFNPLMISCGGKGELGNLRSAESYGEPIRLRAKALLSGLYLNELLIRVLHRHDPCEKIFFNYQQTIRALQKEDKIQKTLRYFEKQLLHELGYSLQFSHEANSNEPIVEDKEYFFSPQHGFTLIKSQISSQSSQAIFLGGHLLAIAHDNFEDTAVLQSAKRLMRLALASLLDNKPLRSREMWV